MDDVRVKYFSKDGANHLVNSLKRHYAISTDWEGRNYLGLTIDCEYSEECVDISMPDYARKALDRLQHPKKKRPQYAPHRWTFHAYGKRLQMAPDLDKNDILDKNPANRIQSIVGTIIYYLRSVDPTMPRAINEIPRVQSQPTRDTAEKSRMLIDYAVTYPNLILRYKASDMFLHVDSNASYLTMIQ